MKGYIKIILLLFLSVNVLKAQSNDCVVKIRRTPSNEIQISIPFDDSYDSMEAYILPLIHLMYRSIPPNYTFTVSYFITDDSLMLKFKVFDVPARFTCMNAGWWRRHIFSQEILPVYRCSFVQGNNVGRIMRRLRRNLETPRIRNRIRSILRSDFFNNRDQNNFDVEINRVNYIRNRATLIVRIYPFNSPDPDTNLQRIRYLERNANRILLSENGQRLLRRELGVNPTNIRLSVGRTSFVNNSLQGRIVLRVLNERHFNGDWINEEMVGDYKPLFQRAGGERTGIGIYALNTENPINVSRFILNHMGSPLVFFWPGNDPGRLFVFCCRDSQDSPSVYEEVIDSIRRFVGCGGNR